MKKLMYLNLTSNCSKIFNIFSRMFEIYEELENYLNPTLSGNDNINIGASNEISRPFTTNIVGQVLKKYRIDDRPKIKLDSGTHENLIERLKLRKLDLIITNRLPNEPDLSVLKTFSMPVGLVGRNDLIKELKIMNLKAADTILKKASSYLSLPTDDLKLRTETNHFYLKNKIKYNAYFESDILSSIVRSAIDGISFCLVPLPYIKKELQNDSLEILPKMGSLWKHQIYIVVRNDKDKRHFVKKLIIEIEALI